MHKNADSAISGTKSGYIDILATT